MRTADFSALVKDCEQMLLSLIGCRGGKVIPFQRNEGQRYEQ